MAISALDTILSSMPDQNYSSTNEDETGIDQFLTLLVAQLQHQDPLNPMEGSDFAVQLAQFTALEQQFTTNDHLEEISAAVNNQEAGDLFDYIGRTVKTVGNTVYVNDGVSDDMAYTMSQEADVSVSIYDADGVLVRSMSEGWQDAGTHVLGWDGKDNQGNTVEDGVYAFEVEAKNENGASVYLETNVTGEVSGITYSGGIPYLMLGEQLISPSRVVEITSPVSNEEDA